MVAQRDSITHLCVFLLLTAVDLHHSTALPSTTQSALQSSMLVLAKSSEQNVDHSPSAAPSATFVYKLRELLSKADNDGDDKQTDNVVNKTNGRAATTILSKLLLSTASSTVKSTVVSSGITTFKDGVASSSLTSRYDVIVSTNVNDSVPAGNVTTNDSKTQNTGSRARSNSMVDGSISSRTRDLRSRLIQQILDTVFIRFPGSPQLATNVLTTNLRRMYSHGLNNARHNNDDNDKDDDDDDDNDSHEDDDDDQSHGHEEYEQYQYVIKVTTPTPLSQDLLDKLSRLSPDQLRRILDRVKARNDRTTATTTTRTPVTARGRQEDNSARGRQHSRQLSMGEVCCALG